ncbi:hypothetical protein DV515_00019127 [Chloebia gouldiae]|uniref:Uncharacterized protein n=1 Tax=Chloebia gouldiae TaxID=44316 RepID=A0A3L8Q6B5_CHLGU|nr:hypothetical protein DV515_00019127 [Chloebia gouldiae]
MPIYGHATPPAGRKWAELSRKWPRRRWGRWGSWRRTAGQRRRLRGPGEHQLLREKAANW